MFVKIEGSYINLDLVYAIDVNDDGTATLWFAGAENVCKDVTASEIEEYDSTRLELAEDEQIGLFIYAKRRFKAPFCFVYI